MFFTTIDQIAKVFLQDSKFIVVFLTSYDRRTIW